MKKILVIVLTAAMLVSVLSACLSDTAASPAPTPTPTATPAPADNGGEDAVTNPSPEKETTDPAQIKKSLSADGTWILSLLGDVTVNEELTVEGQFYDAHDAAKSYRKLALYTQDENRVVTGEFTLTVPKIIVKSPNWRVQQGVIKGDVYVEAEGFELYNSRIDGILTFATQALKDSALLNVNEGATVKPEDSARTIDVGDGADAVTNPSPEKETTDPAQIKKSLSANGTWILSLLGDVTVSDELTVEGQFYDAHDAAKSYRKLALYTQDENRVVTSEFTLTVPKITVKSPNWRIQQGVIKGDVYVEAEGFELYNSRIDGTLTFATQALKDSALLNVNDNATVKPEDSAKEIKVG